MLQNKKPRFTQFNDLAIKCRLLNGDIIPQLEFLLESEGQQLQRLQKLKQEGKLDFGPKISKRRELSSLFSNVKGEVDSFLNVAGMDMPKHGYFSLFRPNRISATILTNYLVGYLFFYEGVQGMIRGWGSENPLTFLFSGFATAFGFGILNLTNIAHEYMSQLTGYRADYQSITFSKEEKRRTNLIPTIAHEYTHHIQNIQAQKLGLGSGTLFSLFREGHARGVQRHVSHLYRERENNEAFLYDITDQTFGELKSAYLWICGRLGAKSRESLVDKKSSRDEFEGKCRAKLKEPTKHAMGNTLFYLCEEQKGSGIYRDMMDGTFEFPNL